MGFFIYNDYIKLKYFILDKITKVWYHSIIEMRNNKMKKYNVKLMNNKKGYLNSFKGELDEKFLFLGFKEERNNFKTEFTKEEIKSIDERYLNFIEEI